MAKDNKKSSIWDIFAKIPKAGVFDKASIDAALAEIKDAWRDHENSIYSVEEWAAIEKSLAPTRVNSETVINYGGEQRPFEMPPRVGKQSQAYY